MTNKGSHPFQKMCWFIEFSGGITFKR